MKLIRRDTDYAFAVIVHLAKHRDTGRQSATELAQALNLPHGFLRKILKALGHAGIVSSAPGKAGGFTLELSPERLTAYDVIKAIQGPIYGTACAVNKYACQNKRFCPVRSAMHRVEANLHQELSSIRIADLLSETNNHEEAR